MAEGQTPGDGETSPFGNHKGATQAGPSSSGRDFSKENRPQEKGNPEERYCPDSPPEGGALPFEDADKASQEARGEMTGQLVEKPKHMPFKLGGG